MLFGARIHSHSLIGVDDFFRTYISFHCYVKSHINCHIYKKGDGNAVYDWALRQQPSKRVPLRMWDLGGRRSPATTDGLITLPQCSIATKTHLYLYLHSFADFDL